MKEKQGFSAGQVEWQLGWAKRKSGHFGSRSFPTMWLFPTHPQPRKDLAMVELENKTEEFSSVKRECSSLGGKMPPLS